jgi:hypothetical protein
LSTRNFRGLEKLEFLPDEHVLLVGEPRAGRSTIIDALYRALYPNGSKSTDRTPFIATQSEGPGLVQVFQGLTRPSPKIRLIISVLLR